MGINSTFLYLKYFKNSEPTLADSGQSCASFHSGHNSPFEKATCLLGTGENLNQGEAIQGFERNLALYPKTCGTKVKTSCAEGGQLKGSFPLYQTCTQLCLNPATGEPAEAGSEVSYFSISTGTKEQCEKAKTKSVCQESTGLFTPQPTAKKVYASCTVLVAHETEILRWSDPETWGGKIPQADANIIIPENKIILLDVSPPKLSSLQVHGILTFDNKDITLNVGAIVLKGTLQIGSPSAPYVNKAVIHLAEAEADDSPTFMRGLFLQGGNLDLHGLPLENADQVRKPAQFAWGLPQFANIKLEK